MTAHDVALPPAPGRRPGLTRPFARLWTAYTVNVAGDEFYALAVPLIVYEVGGTAGSMSLVFACSLLPQVVMGFLGGVLADRNDRITALRRCYLVSALVLLCAVAAFSWTYVSVAGLAAVALLVGGAAAVSAACFDSALPQFVNPGLLSRANAMTEASRTVCVVGGPAAAGFAVAHFAPQATILVNSLTFVTAFALLARMKQPAPPAPAGPAAAADRAGHLRDLATGLRYLLSERRIRTGILTSTLINLVFGAYEPMLVYRLRSDLGAGSGTVGVVFAVAGAVSLGVAVLLSWKAPSRAFLTVMGFSVVLQGVSVASAGLLTSLAGVVAAQTTLVSGMLVYTVYWRSLRQTVVPAELLGRVAGSCRSVAYCGSFVGSLVSAAVLDRFVEVDTALLIAGTAAVLTGAGVVGQGAYERRRGEAA
ncbi:MFS transporter [Streptomyces bathyalis]|uniref:MFS transporter n=1 Tax=Streptomyces bathyalis TaxID=2710756 RepID=A0A7T1WSJ5_9ACTN|nr:MFS transporter [Streptomyces bathyalis]QPP05830.1 MFS transporter [Streptomyces bathyalis]